MRPGSLIRFTVARRVGLASKAGHALLMGRERVRLLSGNAAKEFPDHLVDWQPRLVRNGAPILLKPGGKVGRDFRILARDLFEFRGGDKVAPDISSPEPHLGLSLGLRSPEHRDEVGFEPGIPTHRNLEQVGAVRQRLQRISAHSFTSRSPA